MKSINKYTIHLFIVFFVKFFVLAVEKNKWVEYTACAMQLGESAFEVEKLTHIDPAKIEQVILINTDKEYYVGYFVLGAGNGEIHAFQLKDETICYRRMGDPQRPVKIPLDAQIFHILKNQFHRQSKSN